MAGLVPFNRKDRSLVHTGFGDFYNMLDDFFSDSWMQGRTLLRDTFKIDVRESDKEYAIEAELPGIKKEEIALNVVGGDLCISVNREEATSESKENYIHRERRVTSMSRRVRLANSRPDQAKAKLEEGILSVTVPKLEAACDSCRIEIE